MLIAEAGNDESFTIQVPSDFTFYELSWSCYGSGAYLKLDGQLLGREYGAISASQLLPDTPHTVIQQLYGGLALVYRKD